MLSEFREGKTIVVDKPLGWTSFDVVNKIRWHLKQQLNVKNIKVGHAGTLDPLATGVLVLCTGKHTKRIEELMAGEKTYTGRILLGKTTPSFDLETEFDADYPVDHIGDPDIIRCIEQFTGEIDQVPPLYSAKQIDGKRAYDHARAGRDITLKSNKVNITALTLQRIETNQLYFEVSCSKGTYIRSLARDIGSFLGSGGTLIELRRTRSGNQDLSECLSVEEWIDKIQHASL
jgi:tRNA pseudouridine55 synthase